MNKHVEAPNSFSSAASLPAVHDAGIREPQEKFDPAEVWHAVLEHRAIVAAFLLLGLLAGSYLALQPRRYASEGSIRLQPDAAQAYKISAQALGGEDSDDKKTNSEVRIMQSRTIMLKVAADLNLANNIDFWGHKPAKHFDLADPEARNKVYKQMLEVVKIVHEPRTEVVDISSTTSSPLLSAKITNDIINEYITHIFQVRFGSVDRVSRWMISQLNDLRQAVERDQNQLVDLQAKLGVLGLDQKSGTYLPADSLEDITRAAGVATINRITAEAKLRYLQSADPNLIEGEQALLQGSQPNQPNGLLQVLRSSEAEAAAQYADINARFGSNYPGVKQAKAKLDAFTARVQVEQQRIVNQAKLAYDAASSNEQMTSRALNERKDEAFRSRDDMVKYIILQRTYEGDRNLYEGLTLKLHEAGINAGLESGQVDIVDMADIPTIARKPVPYQLFLLSLFGFLATGCVLAYTVSKLDTRFNSGEEAEKKLALPLLSVLPHFVPKKDEGTLDRLKEQHSAFVEGLQLLRSSILLSRADNAPKTILVTSTLPGEGKSTVSRNLAAMLAMHNARVLLIDADLHKPVQQRAFRLPASVGLSGFLSSQITLEEAVLSVPGEVNLFLMPSGPLPPQPATLLSSTRLLELLRQAERDYDFVVVDAPPVLSVSDPVLLARLVDSVFMVVRQHKANARSIGHAIELLRRGRGSVIGFAMNDVQNRLNRYGNYYGKDGAYGAEPLKGGVK